MLYLDDHPPEMLGVLCEDVMVLALFIVVRLGVLPAD